MNLNQINNEIKAFSQHINRRFSSECKEGLCDWASTTFIKRINRKKHRTISIRYGRLGREYHCWIEVWGCDFSVMVLDFTADQFTKRYPALIFGKKEWIFTKYPYVYIPNLN